MAQLHYFRGKERLTTFNLRGKRVVVGRSDACDVVVPGDAISRRHALLMRDGSSWILSSQGRHGTLVNGRALKGTVTLKDGDELQLHPFRLVFDSSNTQASNAKTSTQAAVAPSVRLVACEEKLVLEQVVCEVVEGPDAGRRIPLTQRSHTIGGPGSDHVLEDTSLRPRHLRIILRHGRPMLRDPAGPVIVDGVRVSHGTLPLYPGEPIRLGDTVVVVGTQMSHESARADSLGEMVGQSDSMQHLFGVLRRIAAFPAPVLIQGESGTGKELAARGVHGSSSRADGPFVAVNCGAITQQLFESELFGHEKGAFTGADSRRDGAFHEADGGTLFLDEIGELPQAAQAKLLRALESGEVRRVGSAKVEYPEVRIVAATNRDLQVEVDQGRFRADLYYRLAVLAVRITPLRERPEDLKPLAEALCRRLGRDVKLTPAALDLLRGHRFPGNVRELKNVLTRAYVLGGPVIRPESVSFSPWSFEGAGTTDSAPSNLTLAKRSERDLIVSVLARHDNNRSAAARELGYARSTLLYKMAKLGIQNKE